MLECSSFLSPPPPPPPPPPLSRIKVTQTTMGGGNSKSPGKKGKKSNDPLPPIRLIVSLVMSLINTTNLSLTVSAELMT